MIFHNAKVMIEKTQDWHANAVNKKHREETFQMEKNV